MIDRERLVQDLYRQHGLVVKADDPVILAALVYEGIFEQVIKKIQELLDGSAAAHEGIAAGYAQESHKLALESVNSGARLVKAQIDKCMRGAEETLAAAITTGCQPLAELVQRAETLKSAMVGAAIFTAVAAGTGIAVMYLIIGGWL